MLLAWLKCTHKGFTCDTVNLRLTELINCFFSAQRLLSLTTSPTGLPSLSFNVEWRLTFGVCWPDTIPLRHAAAVGASGVGAVVGRRHGRSPLAEEHPWCHGLWPWWWLDGSSVELVVCQAAILGVQIVLWRATVLRDFWGLLNYYCLLFGTFLLFLCFLLLLLLTHISVE